MFVATDYILSDILMLKQVKKKKRIFIMGDCSNEGCSSAETFKKTVSVFFSFHFFFLFKKVDIVTHLPEGMKLTPLQVFEPHSLRQASTILL